jgi:hypothetical protein
VKVPPLAVAVLAMGKTLDERVRDAEHVHVRAAVAVAVATSRGYAATGR